MQAGKTTKNITQKLKYAGVPFFLIFLALVANEAYDLFNTAVEINSDSWDVETFNNFGSYFGGTFGTILNSFSVFFLLLALYYQVKQTRISTHELAQASEQMKRSADAQAKAEKALNQQALENTFFNLLNLHNEIIQSLEYTYQPQKQSRFLRNQEPMSVNGRAVFPQIISSLAPEGALATEVTANYQALQTEQNHILGHYFRNLYQIITYIDEYPHIEDNTKERYMKLLRGQLSSSELILLYLNCIDLSVDGGEFRGLVIKYSLLQALPFKNYGVNSAFDEYRKSLANEPIIPGIKGAFDLYLGDLAKYIYFDKYNHVVISAFGDNRSFKQYAAYKVLDGIDSKDKQYIDK
nr:putative phage abortive infection protein [Vibrio sp. Of7-15]